LPVIRHSNRQEMAGGTSLEDWYSSTWRDLLLYLRSHKRLAVSG
jgi:hypothetical protein